ncbi:uncharacterized protein C4orf51 homolog [Trichosurus vulpecula]|uniref:uncharacterized protein C4orf51 homolog n=1 Tax=Trichosurus vulpecula TaxID=9337 RepID=UPI00186B2913|nr:uncharacterized protein C4orf51 homolog [Trichosurus vulpecula]
MADFFFLAPEIVLPFSPLSSEQFNKIRFAAEKSWKNETQWSDRCPTTYGAYYRRKKLDEPPRIQPFSETRLNNPHPHELFLVNKIHYLPGYYNSKAPEPEKNKVSCPEITSFFKDSMNVKQRVMHQVVTPDICLPAHGKNLDFRSRSAVYNSTKSSNPRRRAFPGQTEGIRKWSYSSQGSQSSAPRIRD